MRKRIYRNFIGLVFLSAFVLSTILSLIFYNAFKSRVYLDVRESAQLVASVLNSAYARSDMALSPESSFVEDLEFIGENTKALRITVISPDGSVIFDNELPVYSLENHSDRLEFRSALENGGGEAVRYSTSQMTETYYYAILLDDGNVLRLSRTTEGITSIFLSVLPVVILVTVGIMVIANYFARRLTRNIVNPFESIDFDSENIIAYDELVPYAKRINQQKQEINSQLAAMQNRSDMVLAITNNMREGLILLDDTGKILTANKSALDIFQENEDDISDVDILHICRDIDFQNGVKTSLSGSNAEIVWENSGEYYSIFFSPVLSADEIIGSIVLFFDISDRINAEQLRKEFSANVSHELKTPLTSISALSEMISNGMAKDEDVQGFAEKIAEQARRLMNIIDDIIKLSEFDENRIVRDFEHFDLYSLAQSVLDSLRAEADAKALTVELFGQHIMAFADRQMIDELLYNLLDNAIKYNKTGGSVKVTLSESEAHQRIAVTDTGVGIPLEQQSRVFERFYRVDSSRSKKTGGTGLGLSIVKHIVEYHGGYIELASAPETGTTITCYLPKK
ncbi:MAG: ATP-binding protein [Coriobacteriia bacterium]|nr:ATP-binding protein [Coriobacteriia bacterium]